MIYNQWKMKSKMDNEFELVFVVRLNWNVEVILRKKFFFLDLPLKFA